MSKIFIIGFNKTATRSLHYFFKGNGLPSVHWDNSHLVKCFERNIALGKKLLTDGVVHNTKVNSKGRYEDMVVFSDMTKRVPPKDPAHYYKRLDLDYPNSKFILNIRDTESWIKSRFNHSMPGKRPFEKLYRDHLEYFGLDDNESGRNELKQIYKKMHETHHRDVLEYFKNRKNDLLIGLILIMVCIYKGYLFLEKTILSSFLSCLLFILILFSLMQKWIFINFRYIFFIYIE